MKRILTTALQAVIVLIGIAVFTFMLWEPHFEGRNVNATFLQIYFNDPFLAYAYTVSIAFFMALYQIFKALGYVRQDEIFSQATVKALRTIKQCAMIIIGFVMAAVGYLFIVRPGDDIAGGVFIGILITFVSSVIAIAAAMIEWILQKALTRQPADSSK